MIKKRLLPFLLVYMLCQILLSFSKVYADELIYQNLNRRDPFIPLVSANGEVKKSMDSSGWAVEGIIYDPKQDSVTIINGDFYRVGDKMAVLCDLSASLKCTRNTFVSKWGDSVLDFVFALVFLSIPLLHHGRCRREQERARLAPSLKAPLRL